MGKQRCCRNVFGCGNRGLRRVGGWLTLSLGTWLAVAPWPLGFAHSRAMHMCVGAGSIIAYLAALQLWLAHYGDSVLPQGEEPQTPSDRVKRELSMNSACVPLIDRDNGSLVHANGILAELASEFEAAVALSMARPRSSVCDEASRLFLVDAAFQAGGNFFVRAAISI
jgi:hypothetical protein